MTDDDLWYFRLVVRDWPHDTEHLSGLQRGGLIDLMCRYWTDGSLPNDQARLQKYSHLTPDEWKLAEPAIMDMFVVDGDRLRHPKLDEQRKEIEAKRAQARAAGLASAEAARQRKRSTDVQHERSTDVQRPFNQLELESELELESKTKNRKGCCAEDGATTPTHDSSLESKNRHHGDEMSHNKKQLEGMMQAILTGNHPMTIGNVVKFGEDLAHKAPQSFEAFTAQQVRGAIRDGYLEIVDETEQGNPIVGVLEIEI